jgi:hypothetical protein
MLLSFEKLHLAQALQRLGLCFVRAAKILSLAGQDSVASRTFLDHRETSHGAWRGLGNIFSFRKKRSCDHRHIFAGEFAPSCSAQKARKTFCVAAASNAAKFLLVVRSLTHFAMRPTLRSF